MNEKSGLGSYGPQYEVVALSHPQGQRSHPRSIVCRCLTSAPTSHAHPLYITLYNPKSFSVRF